MTIDRRIRVLSFALIGASTVPDSVFAQALPPGTPLGSAALQLDIRSLSATILVALISLVAVIISGRISAKAIKRASDQSVLTERIKLFELHIQQLMAELITQLPTTRDTLAFNNRRVRLLLLIAEDNVNARHLSNLLQMNYWATDSEFTQWQDDLLSAARQYNAQLFSTIISK